MSIEVVMKMLLMHKKLIEVQTDNDGYIKEGRE